MKKIIILLFIIFIFILTSCSKKYTLTCTRSSQTIYGLTQEKDIITYQKEAITKIQKTKTITLTNLEDNYQNIIYNYLNDEAKIYKKELNKTTIELKKDSSSLTQIINIESITETNLQKLNLEDNNIKTIKENKINMGYNCT